MPQDPIYKKIQFYIINGRVVPEKRRKYQTGIFNTCNILEFILCGSGNLASKSLSIISSLVTVSRRSLQIAAQ